MKIFQLTWADYDCSDDYFFKAPEDATFADFQTLCDRLMRESAAALMAANTKFWIGYMGLLQEVADRLPGYGYERLQFEGITYSHGSIIDGRWGDVEEEKKVLGDLYPKVVEYNKALRESKEKRRNDC